MYKHFFFVLIAILFVKSTASGSDFVSCQNDPLRLNQRSEELQTLVNADQEDRSGNTPIDWGIVGPRDETRRKRVGEIFGEGCFKTAQDFAAAALVFQHGDVPEHYFQTFLWAKRSIELGDKSQKQLMADGIDRYLISIGHKQIYGTQGWKTAPGACHCLDTVELTFPDKRRKADADWSLKQGLEMVGDFDKEKNCGKPVMCNRSLKPTPRGFIPGWW